MKQIFLLAHPEARARAVQAVKEAPEGYTLTLGPKDKTAEQRGKFHVLCEKIGNLLGETPAHIKGAIKQDLYGFDEFKIGNVWYRHIHSTEDNDREQYSALIEHAFLWAAERGAYVE